MRTLYGAYQLARSCTLQIKKNFEALFIPRLPITHMHGYLFGSSQKIESTGCILLLLKRVQFLVPKTSRFLGIQLFDQSGNILSNECSNVRDFIQCSASTSLRESGLSYVLQICLMYLLTWFQFFIVALKIEDKTRYHSTVLFLLKPPDCELNTCNKKWKDLEMGYKQNFMSS